MSYPGVPTSLLQHSFYVLYHWSLLSQLLLKLVVEMRLFNLIAAALLAGVFVVGAAANTGRSILMRISGQRIVANVRAAAYRNVLRQDAAWYDLQGQNPSDSLATAGALEGPQRGGEAAKSTAVSSSAAAPEIKVKGCVRPGSIRTESAAPAISSAASAAMRPSSATRSRASWAKGCARS